MTDRGQADAAYDVGQLSQHPGAQERRGPLRPRRFRLRRGEGRQQPVQAGRARREIRFRRARDRHLSAGQGLRQALRAAAGRAGEPRPAPHHRLQCGARAAQAVRPRGQAGRCARLYGDDRRPGCAASSPSDYGVDLDKIAMDHLRGSACRRISSTRRRSSARRPARSSSQMLLDGELDAAVVGDKLSDPRLKHLIPDAEGGGPQMGATPWRRADQPYGGGARRNSRNPARTSSRSCFVCWWRANGPRTCGACGACGRRRA